MKIALLLPSNRWFCPYANIYIQILNEIKVDYTLLYWNRDGSEKDENAFNMVSPYGEKKITKIIDYVKFVKFIKQAVMKGGYDRLIVFSPQLALFLFHFLKKNFDKRYLFDYRDLSIEQHAFLHKRFEKVVSHSFANVISSYGFLEKLPKGEYLISHNFDAKAALESLNSHSAPSMHQGIKILTIGSIRDFASNSKIVSDVANSDEISISFIGKGEVASRLSKFAKMKDIRNVDFKGYYDKCEEKRIVLDYDIINAYQPTFPNAMTNRLYLSLILKRPILVAKHTIQAEFVEKYGLGVSVEPYDNVAECVKDFFKTFDYKNFSNNCNEVLRLFLNDYNVFRRRVEQFVTIQY